MLMLVAGVPGAALAQLAAYPTRPITVIVPLAPGTVPYVRARLYMHKLGERWGVPVIVENRPGASGNIGFGLAAKAGGVVNASFLPAESLIGLVQGGRVRVLAALGLARNPLFPDAPTVGEEGFPNVQVRTWNGLLTPASTPPDIVRKLNLEMNAILQLPDIQEVVIKRNGAPDPCSSE